MKVKYQNYLYLLAIVLGVGLITPSCKPNKETQKAPQVELKVSHQTISLPSDGGSKDITVTCNIKWEAKKADNAPSWLSVSSTGKSVTISAEPNPDAEIRKGNIQIEAGGKTQTISVNQFGLKPQLITDNKLLVPADGGIVDVTIMANVPYDVSIEKTAIWLKEFIPSPDGLKAELVADKRQYEIEPNETGRERTAKIKVRGKDAGKSLSETITLVQPAVKIEKAEVKEVGKLIKVKVTNGTATSEYKEHTIDQSYDGEEKTIYHSHYDNKGSDYFPITLTYFFNNESIDRIIYHPRADHSSNGNFKEVEIYVKHKDKAQQELYKTIDFQGAKGPTIVECEERLNNVEYIAFKVLSGAGDGQGFVSCSEMEFLRFPKGYYNPLQIFTDKSISELRPEVQSLETIKAIPEPLYKEIAMHLFNNTYKGKEFRIQSYRAWPLPHIFARNNKTSSYSLLDNPTGIYVKEGEKFVAFVGDTHGRQVSLRSVNLDKPGGDGFGQASVYALAPGANTFTAKRDGLLYVMYNALDYKDAPRIKIHISRGTVNGYYDKAKYKGLSLDEQRDKWYELLNKATYKYFDLVGDSAHLTFETAQFKNVTGKKGPDLINLYDDMVHREQDHLGLFKYQDAHPERINGNRAYFHVMYHSYMYSTAYRTAYNASTTGNILNPTTFKRSPWGPAHELGHTHQTRPGFKWIGMTEVTVNMMSLWVQKGWGNRSRLQAERMGAEINNRYEKNYRDTYVKKIPHPKNGDVFCKLVPLWQIYLYFGDAKGYKDIYRDYYEHLRTTEDARGAGLQQLRYVQDICDITKTNLLPFFEKTGFLTPIDIEIDDYGKGQLTITEANVKATKDYVNSKGYKKQDQAIEYICDANVDLFKANKPVTKGSVTYEASTRQVTFRGCQHAVAYEVKAGDKLAAASNFEAFKVPNNTGIELKNLSFYAVAADGTRVKIK